MKRFLYSIALLFSLFLVSQFSLSAQTISLFNINSSGYPTIKGEVLAMDRDGTPVKLQQGNLELRENGKLRKITLLSCPDPKPIERISSVLTIDISSSMRGSNDKNVKIAQAAARAWVDGLPLGFSECAITSFNGNSYLNQDFTIDARKLHDAINGLMPNGETSYDAALVAPGTGAIPVAMNGKHKRVVVFLTDGQGTGHEAEIIAAATAANVTVHCIAVGLNAPPILRNIANATGGRWFENVTTVEEAVAIYRLILGESQGGSPCRIEWESGPECDPNQDVNLQEKSLPASTTTTYQLPARALIELTPSSGQLRFGGIAAGGSGDQTVRLTAGAAPVTILSITSSDPDFTVVTNGAPPSYTIPANSFVDVTFRFTPHDSSYHYAELHIETDGCRKVIYGSGGRWGGSSGGGGGTAPDLKLLFPNGGERFPVGTQTSLVWTGVAPEDTVNLYYSTDAGGTWQLLSDRATGMEYPWTVPNTPSERCLAKVSIEGRGGDSGYLAPHVLHLYEQHATTTSGKPIVRLRFSPDGKYVLSATGERGDPVRIWRTFDGVLHDSHITEGRVIDLDYSGDGTRHVVAHDNGWDLYSNGSKVSERLIGIAAIALSNPDGNYVAVGMKDGSISIYTKDRTLYRQIPASEVNLGEITSIDFDEGVVPAEFAVVGKRYSDSIRVFSINGTLSYQLPSEVGATGHIGSDPISSIRFNQDGGRMVTTSSGDGTPLVWSRRGLRADLHLTGGGHNDAAFSPDGKYVVAGYGDLSRGGKNAHSTTSLFDAWSGQLLLTLDDTFNSAAVVCIDITQIDGNYYVATGMYDGTIEVWEISPSGNTGTPGASDISDSLWAIVTTELTAKDVSFGQQVMGNSRDSVVVAYIRNSGGLPVDVSQMNIRGADPSSFSIISGDAPFHLEPGGVRDVEIGFNPQRTGNISATMEIVSTAPTLNPSLTGVGIAPALKLDVTLIDFGMVELGDAKDSVVTSVLSNIGTVPVTITSIVPAGPNNGPFTILAGDAPFTLPPGASHQMRLSFRPSEVGRTSGSLDFVHNGPGGALRAVLLGGGFCPAPITQTTVGLSSEHGAPGDTIRPVLTINPLDLPTPIPPGVTITTMPFTVELGYNSTLLAPLDRSARTMQSGDSGGSAIFHGTWDPSDGTIDWQNGGPLFIAGLGDAESTDVTIRQMRWEIGCPPEAAVTHGTFTLDELCREGTTRLFSPGTGRLKLAVVGSNPVQENGIAIEFELIEPGMTELYLANMEGERIATLVRGEMEGGAYLSRLGTERIPSGQYLLLLQTPTSMVSRKVVVRR